LTVIAEVSEQDDGIDISVSLPDSPGVSINIPLDPDLMAILGKEYTDPVELAALASSGGASPFSLSLYPAGGAAYPAVRKDNRNTITVRPDTPYRIVLENRSNETVSASVFIDGVNTIYQTRELPSGGYKWVLNPQSRTALPGWQYKNNTAAPFVFTNPQSSIAAQIGYPSGTGRVTVVFYVEPRPATASAGVRRGIAGTGAGAAQSNQVSERAAGGEKKAVQIIQIWYEFE
jgi:hypothetical protein